MKRGSHDGTRIPRINNPSRGSRRFTTTRDADLAVSQAESRISPDSQQHGTRISQFRKTGRGSRRFTTTRVADLADSQQHGTRISRFRNPSRGSRDSQQRGTRISPIQHTARINAGGGSTGAVNPIVIRVISVSSFVRVIRVISVSSFIRVIRVSSFHPRSAFTRPRVCVLSRPLTGQRRHSSAAAPPAAEHYAAARDQSVCS